ncbi:hypothetical protein CVV68_20640 [Arthrobacter livingstonensis]|uniref:Condensation domain-containing protein n=1 Tax=Arthrobacter livingstonensis TaxID=670078 RepID=A0A2V5L0R8_9MICC|nr:hypothetical protein CVV68_20640 [Arthrobacter livingstonensis]
MHHIATDGWSLHLMLTEISGLYADLVDGRTGSRWKPMWQCPPAP